MNMFIVSIPTVLDPGLAPEGKHLVHIYTAGNEPYALWEGLKRGSPEYEVSNRAMIRRGGKCWLRAVLNVGVLHLFFFFFFFSFYSFLSMNLFFFSLLLLIIVLHV